MSEGIAIVGMGCRYPDAQSPSALWENVLAQRRAFRRIPPERLRLEDYQPAGGATDGPGIAGPWAAGGPRAAHPAAIGTAAAGPWSAANPADLAAAGPGLAGEPGQPDSDSLYLQEAALLAGWEFDRLRFKVAGGTFRSADPTHWLALEVAAAALADAGFEDGAGLPRDATGVLLGNTLTGEFARAQLMRLRWPYVRRTVAAGLAAEGWPQGRIDAFLARLEPSYKAPFPAPCEESLAGGLSNTIAGRVCNHFDLHGGGYTVDGACASSLLAVAQACSALAAGDLDVALAGGVDLSLDPFELVGFARLGALATGEMRVFDARSDGFIPGEGCGFVVLMRESQAAAAGKRIHAVIRGWGISSDGGGGISRPEVAGQRLALARAYRRAGFDISTVPLFEGHGTGTAVGDAVELAALSQELHAAAAARPAGQRPAAIGSIKANIGHTKAAAGVAGLIKAAQAVANRVLPPATGCGEPHPALLAGEGAAVLRVPAAAEPWPAGRPLRAGVSAMGFGGINAHLVVEGPGAPPARPRRFTARERRLAAAPQDVELVLLAGAGIDELTAAVRRIAALAPRLSRAELGDLACELHRQWRDAQAGTRAPAARAAIVAATPRQLFQNAGRLLQWLEEATAGRGPGSRLDPRQGIFLGAAGAGEAPSEAPPAVGLLFTGQGSPAYAGGGGRGSRGGPARLGGALGSRCEDLAGIYRHAAALMSGGGGVRGGGGGSGRDSSGGSGSGDSGDLEDGADAGVDTAVAQPAIVAHSLAGAWLLERLGVRAAVAIGHSLGELTALCWAGACDARTALRLAAARGRAMADKGDPGAMASLAAVPELVTELLAGADATIAAYNGAARTVVAGSREAVAAVVERAAARGIAASRLKVARAFHSPRVAAAAGDLDRALAAVAWQPPRRPVVSTITGAPLGPEADPRALLLDQLTSPVRFTGALAAARPLAGLWIEVGPGRALADLASEELGAPVLALDAGGPSLAGPLTVAGALFAAGVQVDLDCFYAGRFHRPFDLERPASLLANPCESAPLPAPAPAMPAAGTLAPGTSPPAATVERRSQASTSTVAPPATAAGAGAVTAQAAGAVTGPGAAAIRRPAAGGRTATAGVAIAPGEATVTAPAAAPLDLVRGLVAARAELPVSAVRHDSRLLGDLHLNSIAVGQLVSEAGRRLGLPPSASPTDYAHSTVGEVAQALAARVSLEGGRSANAGAEGAASAIGSTSEPTAAAAPVAGVDTWVRPFTVALVERPLEPVPAGAPAPGMSSTADAPPVSRGARPSAGWQVIAPAGHPWAPAIAAALRALPEAAAADAAGPAPAVAAALAALPEGPAAASATGQAPDILLCLPAELDEGEPGHLRLFVEAARAACGPPAGRRFVLVQQGGGGAGFARTLHLELATVATWVIDLPSGASPEAAAARVAAEVAAGGPPPASTGDAGQPGATATRGLAPYVEAHYDEQGTRRVPLLRALAQQAAERPAATAERPPEQAGIATAEAVAGWAALGLRDVLLATGGGKGIGAECALALARATGARLAILGRSDPRSDPELAANLARMSAAGVEPFYLRADAADAPAVAAAVERAAGRLGPITALLHAAGINQPRRLAALDDEGLRQALAPKVTGCRHLLDALAARQPGSLRLVVGFGSIIARTGLHGEAEYALANEWLARLLARHARSHPACRCLLIDWSVWSGTGMGERLGTLEALTRQGIVPIPPDAGAAELLRLVADPEVRGEVVVTGRFGNPPALPVERPPLPLLRFLETPRVYYPGIELVVDAEVTADTDPYLSDHVFRGEPLFAAVLGLEAMAQAAAAVAGTGVAPQFEQVELLRPVAVPPGRSTTLRLAALVREPGRVEVALRERSTGFAADHFRAVCRFGPGAAGAETPAPPAAVGAAVAAAGTPARSSSPPTRQSVAARPAAPSRQATAIPSRLPIEPPRDLYGSILFQDGRFRRVGGYRRLLATECLAEIAADGAVGWFGRYLPPALLLGDPAARDAAIHAIQACIPHAQLLPVGVEHIQTGRIAADEALLIDARERRREGDVFVYDLDVLDAKGGLRERWLGLRLRAVDRTRLPAAWTAPLLAPYLERRLQDLLPGAGLRVALEAAGGTPRRGRGGKAEATPEGRIRVPHRAGRAGRQPSDPIVERLVARGGTLSGGPRLHHRPDGRPEIPGGPAVSIAHAANLVLAVAGDTLRAPLGCDLEAIAERSPDTWRDLLGAERFALAELIAGHPGERSDTAATRVWTAAESLHKAGSPAGAPLLLEATLDDGWLLLRSGNLRIASFAAPIRELGGPCAVAVAATEAQASSPA
jgi:enediyne polyketide synthase